MGPTGCPEKYLSYWHYCLRNIPEEYNFYPTIWLFGKMPVRASNITDSPSEKYDVLISDLNCEIK